MGNLDYCLAQNWTNVDRRIIEDVLKHPLVFDKTSLIETTGFSSSSVYTSLKKLTPMLRRGRLLEIDLNRVPTGEELQEYLKSLNASLERGIEHGCKWDDLYKFENGYRYLKAAIELGDVWLRHLEPMFLKGKRI